MNEQIKVILLALECLLKTTASTECHEIWKLPKEKFEEFQKTRENYINSTIKYINEVKGE